MKFWNRLRRRPPVFSGSLAPGMQVHGWKVLRELGKARNGTFHEVERAGRRSVLKWFAPGPELESLVSQELTCHRRVSSPLFARLEGHGRWPDPERGGAFLVQEAVPGLSLHEWYTHSGPSPSEIVGVFQCLMGALVVMHDAGVRYPQLTCPDVRLNTATLLPVIVDMGGAVAQLGPVPGEQSTWDVHGLGEMLYELLTLRPPGQFVLPPHRINPQVPLILSELAMYLLAV